MKTQFKRIISAVLAAAALLVVPAQALATPEPTQSPTTAPQASAHTQPANLLLAHPHVLKVQTDEAATDGVDYATVEAAIAAITADGQVVQLNTDVTRKVVVETTYSFKLDLNNHKISHDASDSDSVALEVKSGNVTVINGTIESTNTASLAATSLDDSVITVLSGGKLTLGGVASTGNTAGVTVTGEIKADGALVYVNPTTNVANPTTFTVATKTKIFPSGNLDPTAGATMVPCAHCVFAGSGSVIAFEGTDVEVKGWFRGKYDKQEAHDVEAMDLVTHSLLYSENAQSIALSGAPNFELRGTAHQAACVLLMGERTGTGPYVYNPISTVFTMTGGNLTNKITGSNGYYAMAGSHLYDGGTITISGGRIISSAGMGIYHPQNANGGTGGTITVGSGNQEQPVRVEGTVGIAMGGGALTVLSGTQLVSDDTNYYSSPQKNASETDGPALDGAAVQLASRTDYGPISLDIQGGLFGAKSNNIPISLYAFSKSGGAWTTDATAFDDVNAPVIITVDAGVDRIESIVKSLSKWAPDEFASARIDAMRSGINESTYVIGNQRSGSAILKFANTFPNMVRIASSGTVAASGQRTLTVTFYDCSAAGFTFNNDATHNHLPDGTKLVNATNSTFDGERTGDESELLQVTNDDVESPYTLRPEMTYTSGVPTKATPTSAVIGYNEITIKNQDGTPVTRTTAEVGDTMDLQATGSGFAPFTSTAHLGVTNSPTGPIVWSAIPSDCIKFESDPYDKTKVTITVLKQQDTTITASYFANSAVHASFKLNESVPDPESPIPPWDLGQAVVTLNKDNWVYDESLYSQYTPSVSSVTLRGETLILDTDYTVSYLNNTSTGTADDPDESKRPTVVLTAISSSTKVIAGTTAKKYFTISKYNDLINAQVELEWEPTSGAGIYVPVDDSTYTYDGQAKMPHVKSVKITDPDGVTKTLAAGTQYNVTYLNNVNAGNKDSTEKPTVRITAANTDYTGTKDVYFTINPKDITAAAYNAEVKMTNSTFTYNGRAQAPTVTGVQLSDGSILSPGNDFTVTAYNNVKVNSESSSPRITVTAKGNYTGSRTVPFTINPKSFTDATVKLDELGTQPYTGMVVTPSVVITDTDIAESDPGNTTLVKDVDYTVSYNPSSPIEVGTDVTVTIMGRGNYTSDVRTLHYRIARPLDDDTVTLRLTNSQFTYDGKVHIPRVTVTLKSDGTVLEQDKDYKVSTVPDNPIEVGDYKLVITGMGEYAGTMSKDYRIVQGADNPDTADTPDVPEKPDKVNPDKDPNDPYPNSDERPLVKAGLVDYKRGDTATVEVIVDDDGTVTVEAFTLDGQRANGWQIAGGNTYYAENGICKTGLSLVEDRIYAFNPDGILCTGFLKDYDTGRVYLASGKDTVSPGVVQSNKWIYAYDNWYLTNRDGEVVTGWYLDNATGQRYYLHKKSDPQRTGTMSRDEWLQVDGAWYVTDKDGTIRTGWVTDATGQKFYLNPNFGDGYGQMQTGWIVDPSNGQRYYLFTASDAGQTGALARNGWLWDGEKWYLVAPDGHICTGWAWDNSSMNWYYLNPAVGPDYGQVQTGWVYDMAYRCWFYLFREEDQALTGVLARGGFLLVDGVWYLPNDIGEIRGGWQWFTGAWYHLHDTSDGTYGSLDVGWVWDAGKWYHTDADGRMQMGFVDVGPDTYFLDDGSHGNTGAMLRGWQFIDGFWYYFTDSGALLRNAMTPDGYWVNLNGAWI